MVCDVAAGLTRQGGGTRLPLAKLASYRGEDGGRKRRFENVKMTDGPTMSMKTNTESKFAFAKFSPF
jgi:hypothetical protein